MANFNDMSWEDFSQAHGGRRTKALAARFRNRKGLDLTGGQENAILEEAFRRAQAQAYRQSQGAANSPDLSVGGTGVVPSKPLPGINNDMLGAPDAPRVGGRTSPGTTPRAKSNMPGGVSQMPQPMIGREWTPTTAPSGYDANKLRSMITRKAPKKPYMPRTKGVNVQRQF